MENSRKNLKLISIAILVFAFATLLQLLTELMFGEINNAELPEGSPENILLITKIVVMVISCIILLPQLYVGIKGLKVAKNPDTLGAHIFWATVLFVIAILGLISPIKAIFSRESIKDNVLNLSGKIVEVFLYFEYLRHAKALS